MCSISASVTCLTTFPGLPKTNDLSGIILFSVTNEFAPIENSTRNEFRLITTASADVPLKGLDYSLRALKILKKDAEDQNTPIIVPGVQRSYSALLGQSQANIFSYNYNITNGQNIGFLATNRAFDGGGNGLLYSMNGSRL